jgi:hypothetical protein
MTKRIRAARLLQCACVIFMGVVTGASAAAPTAKTIACLNTCEQVLMACMQPTLQISPDRRTIKDLNVVRDCNQADGRCDRRCRGGK